MIGWIQLIAVGALFFGLYLLIRKCIGEEKAINADWQEREEW